jgi:uncharacterized membrane protein
MGNLQSKWLFLGMVTLAAAAGFMLALPGGATALRAVLGIYLVLVGPGLAFTTALLPAKQLGTAEHMLAALAASIALAVISGLILDATSWGLQPISWSVILGGATVAASFAALLRLRRTAGMNSGTEIKASTRVPADDSAPAANRAHLSTLRIALPVVAIVLLGLAIYVARMPAAAEAYQGYTTLWLAPDGKQVGSSVAVHRGARIGVQSEEFAPTSYRLEVRVNGQVANVWPELRLEPNQTWQAQLVLPDAARAAMEVEAILYRVDAPGIVYRQVRFGIGNTGKTN